MEHCKAFNPSKVVARHAHTLPHLANLNPACTAEPEPNAGATTKPHERIPPPAQTAPTHSRETNPSARASAKPHKRIPARPSHSLPARQASPIAAGPCHGHRVAACRHRPAFARRAAMPTSARASSTWWRPAEFPQHILRYRNQRWAARVGLDGLTDAEWVDAFRPLRAAAGQLRRAAGAALSRPSVPDLQPELGDGRGFLFAQLARSTTAGCSTSAPRAAGARRGRAAATGG